MNLLLLYDDDFVGVDRVSLLGRRATHLRQVLGVEPGRRLRVGLLGGALGEGEVIAVSDGRVQLSVRLDEPPPARPGICLLLAMPRPKALKRLLPAFASLGLDAVVLCGAARVERSYFTSHAVSEARIRDLLREGLEQGRDTVPPEVHLRPRLRALVEDELDGLLGGGGDAVRLIADPVAPRALSAIPAPRLDGGAGVTLAIGPEGGWTDEERALLAAAGFTAVALAGTGSTRPLRTEIAIPVLVGQVMFWRAAGGAG